MRYGIYDTKDNLWLGDGTGPRSFSEGDSIAGSQMTSDDAFTMARICAEATNFAMGWDINRAKAKEMPEGSWTLRDELEKKRTEAEWLTKKERGTIV